MHNMKRVFGALKAIGKVEREAEKIAAEEYPVGTLIEWERGRGIQCGVILTSSYHHGPRFRVRNARSRREYWIDFYDVVRAAGDDAIDEYFERAA